MKEISQPQTVNSPLCGLLDPNHCKHPQELLLGSCLNMASVPALLQATLSDVGHPHSPLLWDT